MNAIQAYKEIIYQCDTRRGAPMGRANKGTYPETVVRGRNCRICKCDQTKVYTRRVPLIDGYDNGGAYWGIGKPLYVEYTKDLSFVNFYRI